MDIYSVSFLIGLFVLFSLIGFSIVGTLFSKIKGLERDIKFLDLTQKICMYRLYIDNLEDVGEVTLEQEIFVYKINQEIVQEAAKLGIELEALPSPKDITS